MTESVVKNLRLPFSQILGVLVLLFIAISQSAWESRSPLISSVLFLVGVLFVAIASLGRLWCSLYIAGWKTRVLITKGPYSMCRNPLYFFTLIGVIGVGLASERLLIPSILVLSFGLYYPWVIKEEENKLQRLHGERFRAYRSRVPRFFPRFSKLVEPREYVVNPTIFRKHILSALWFVWLVGILEVIEALHDVGALPIVFKIY
jgi:protein-S-isoprenylcysteine O-methyltransferase Ste14